MRYASMNLRQTTMATVLFTFPAAAAWSQGAVPENSTSTVPQPQPKHLQILFTDHLLGYYRIPEIQTEDFQTSCPEPGSKPPTVLKTPAEELLPKIQKGNTTILVGMGNNFAVEFGARTYLDTS